MAEYASIRNTGSSANKGHALSQVGGKTMAPPALGLTASPSVGKLCIVSNVVSEGLSAGHAWLSYTPKGGSETTYGTWGNLNPKGLYRDRELGQAAAARRCTDIDAGGLNKLEAFANSNNAWSLTNNCASFAARGWKEVTGEHIPHRSLGIPNPSALGAGIQSLGAVKDPANTTGAKGGSSSL